MIVPVGHPIPLDEHACSVSLPQWSDVVGYEEGDVAVTSKMICGYPRFVYHPYVIRLMNVSLAIDRKRWLELTPQEGEIEKGSATGISSREWDCIVLPSRDAAYRARDFLIKSTLINEDERELDNTLSRYSNINSSLQLTSPDNALEYESGKDKDTFSSGLIRVMDLKTATSNIHALIFPAETKFALAAKAYWQHTGELVSSRRAETALMELDAFDAPSSSSKGDEKKSTRVTHSLLSSSKDEDRVEHSTATKEVSITCPRSNQSYACKYPIRKSMCDNLKQNQDIANPKMMLRKDLAAITHTSPDNVHLSATGMGAIYTALRASRRLRLFGSKDPRENGGASIVYGFPYLDTLKQCGRPELCPGGVEFFGNGDEVDLENLTSMLEHRRSTRRHRLQDPTADAGVCALITEFPSNPLLNCHDMMALRDLATEYNFVFVVDDTIGNFANVDLIRSGIADVVCTSLTKLYSGRGDVMAGSLICNPHTIMGRAIGANLLKMREKHNGAEEHEDYLYHSDAVAMYHNSQDFMSRSSRINETSEKLADWLKGHPNVQAVYYPKFTQPDMYKNLMHKDDDHGISNDEQNNKTEPHPTHTAGFGGLMSILLEPHMCQRTFYDTLAIYKGPSLGTNFSLACPYTLLAHYHELEFARAYKVSPNLIRIAVGLEPFEDLKKRFEDALRKSKLYPPLSPPSMNSSPASSNMQQRAYCSRTTHTRHGALTLTMPPTPILDHNGSAASSLRKIHQPKASVNSLCSVTSPFLRRTNCSSRVGLSVCCFSVAGSFVLGSMGLQQ